MAAGAAGPVPAHTSASSISWVSPSLAFVLGTAPCTQKPCTVVLETSDGGASWVGLPAPAESISYPGGRGLWGIRFADAEHGFAYGDGLWETSDGGASWKEISRPAKLVLDLEVTAGKMLLAVATKGTAAPDLYTRPVAGGAWKRIRAVKPLDRVEAIATHGQTAWVDLGAELLVSTNAGRSFTIHPSPCGGTARTPVSLASTGGHTYLLCIGQGFTGHTIKFVFSTTGTQHPWKLVGRPSPAGDGGLLAAGSDHALMIATASAASWLYRSTDSGRRWRTALTYGDGGAGWADLAFTTPTRGAVIHGPASKDGGSPNFPGQLLLTSDGGRTWQTAPF